LSGNYFAVLGIRPYLGRLFSRGDDESKTRIAVMTWSCWKRLGSDPNIVGKALAKKTIVGVTPKNFTGPFYGLNGDLLTTLHEIDDNASWFTQRGGAALSHCAAETGSDPRPGAGGDGGSLLAA
jgi:hypothetical protein